MSHLEIYESVVNNTNPSHVELLEVIDENNEDMEKKINDIKEIDESRVEDLEEELDEKIRDLNKKIINKKKLDAEDIDAERDRELREKIGKIHKEITSDNSAQSFNFVDDDDFSQRERANLIAKDLISTNRFLTIMDVEEIYYCEPENNVWNSNGEKTLKSMVVELAKNNFSTSLLRNVKNNLQGQTYIDRDELGFPEGIIVDSRGRKIDIESGEIIGEVEINDYCMNQLNAEYDPDAESGEVENMIKDSIPTERQLNRLQEWFGYSLSKGQGLKKLLMIVGPSDSGKSTVLNILQKLHDDDSIENMSLKDLASNRFAPVNLYGKQLNIRSELPEDLSRIDTIKELTGKDPISAEKKRVQDRLRFTSNAKLIFSGNNTPSIPSRDNALIKRTSIVEFDNPIPENEQKSNYVEEIVDDEELSWVLNWAIKGYQRLIDNGFKFSNKLSPRETRDMLKKWGQPINRFVYRETERKENGYIPVDEMKQEFNRYARANDYSLASKTKITQELAKIGIEKSTRKVGNDHVYCYVGIDWQSRGDLSNISRVGEKNEQGIGVKN